MGDDAGSLSQEQLDPRLHRWLRRQRCWKWRQWCLHPSPGWNHFLSLSIPAGDLSSNYRAERHALKAAIEHLIEEDCSQQNIVLLSDSLSALQSLTNSPTDHPTQQLHNSLCALSSNNKVALQRVPAHAGIAGNGTADRLATAAAKLPQRHLSTSYKVKNNGYDPQKDQINTLDRRTQTTTFRLRTGHCGLEKLLKRLGPADPAFCEWGFEEPTPEHIRQTCPHLEIVRQRFWPEDTEMCTKFGGGGGGEGGGVEAAELQHGHHIERRRRTH